MNSEIPRLAEQIVEIAVNRGFKIGFAESLTGGLISSVIVGVPGASRCFEGSVVSYSNEVKIRVLGVDEDVALFSIGLHDHDVLDGALLGAPVSGHLLARDDAVVAAAVVG